MKNSGEAVEKVLAGLRDAEAPAGMQRRILDGLQARGTTARSGLGWRGLLPVWLVAQARPVAVASAVCGIALASLFVVLAVPAIRRLGHAPAPASGQVRRNPAAAGGVTLGASEIAERGGRTASASRRAGAGSRAEVARSTTGIKRSAGDSEAVLDSDAVALDDLHAASRPAPPMPLTEQERLLLRLVHKDDPVELAMLDPKARALQDLEDKAEFQRFFGQSVKQAPEQSVTEQAGPQQLTTEQGGSGQSTKEEAPQGTEQVVPERGVPEQPAMEQTVPPPSTQQKFAPDQSDTQQAPKTTRTTGENE